LNARLPDDLLNLSGRDPNALLIGASLLLLHPSHWRIHQFAAFAKRRLKNSG